MLGDPDLSVNILFVLIIQWCCVNDFRRINLTCLSCPTFFDHSKLTLSKNFRRQIEGILKAHVSVIDKKKLSDNEESSFKWGRNIYYN